jgi:hypothetical protein
MRVTMLAGSGLSLLLACTVAATAEQRSTTCADRTQQVKKAQDQLAVLVPQVEAQRLRCIGATADRRRGECMPYGVSLTLQKKQESDLKALTDDPAWRACSVSAGGTRYAPASVPNSSTTPGGGQTSPANTGQNSPATMGQGSGGGGRQSGSGTGGSGATPGTRGSGSDSSGGGGRQMSSLQGANCGGPGCSATQSKGGAHGLHRPASGRPQRTASQHRGGFGSSHYGGHSGRSSSHGRRR